MLLQIVKSTWAFATRKVPALVEYGRAMRYPKCLRQVLLASNQYVTTAEQGKYYSRKQDIEVLTGR